MNKSINRETGEHDRIAAIQRGTANALSLGRAASGAAIGTYAVVAESYQSVPLAVGVAVASASDGVDGYLARRAAGRIKSGTTRFGQWVDQLSDKVFSHFCFLGFAISELMGDTAEQKAYGAALLTAESYMLWRDKRATEVRLDLEFQGKEHKARLPGKVKAALGMVTLTAAASPLAEQANWQLAIGTGALAVAGLAAYSLHDLQNQLDLPAANMPLPVEDSI